MRPLCIHALTTPQIDLEVAAARAAATRELVAPLSPLSKRKLAARIMAEDYDQVRIISRRPFKQRLMLVAQTTPAEPLYWSSIFVLWKHYP